MAQIQPPLEGSPVYDGGNNHYLGSGCADIVDGEDTPKREPSQGANTEDGEWDKRDLQHLD